MDSFLVQRGLAESRAKATALILAGRVLVNGLAVTKAGALVAAEAEVTLKPAPHQYVSRGGEKLAAALEHFGVDVSGLVCLDAGASTGGFTHCLLLGGAAKVYAVDVGYGQLDQSLRKDSRVVVLERVNIRLLPKEAIPEPVHLATLDLSFISLTLVLPKILEFLAPGAAILALVKPQFEVGKGQVGKGGVVRDPQLQQEAVTKVARAGRELGLTARAAFPSPLKRLRPGDAPARAGVGHAERPGLGHRGVRRARIFRFKLSMLKTIGISAALGVVYHLVLRAAA